VLPDLITAFGAAPDPDTALGSFDRLVERLPSALNLFRLLEARPALLGILVDVMAHAPTLSEALAAKPALLDRLLDATAFDPVGSVAELAAEMRGTSDLETRLDRVRHLVGEHRFALGTQIVRGVSDPMEVAGGYARVAEAAVVTVAGAVIEEFAATHGRVAGSELVVLALGRLGGSALTHASDLDLIYLFTGDFAAESDGAKPLGATHYYNRLAQRLSSGLSAPTSAGALYEIDTRLRPSGAQGPLVVSLDSFARYQREAAWTWEHMALTRARPIYGSDSARSAVAMVIGEVLSSARDPAIVVRDAAKMRADIAAHKPPLGALDVKLGKGGLVDLEFAVHVRQLTRGIAFDPDLAKAITALVGAELFEDGVGAAYTLLTRLLVTLRLVSPRMEVPPAPTCAIVARACGARDGADLLAQVDAARQCIARAWAKASSDSGA
jgi:[glutamine synthetase] adenylyltransferase / [glutamine synthetase]-adenylyl-L-tyrosine phosphorylase